MSDPDPRELKEILDLARVEAERYLDELPYDPVRTQRANEAALAFDGSLPEEGKGGVEALRELLDGSDALIRSSGPRFFHWVIGGTTPAALGADWLTSTFDQNGGAWDSSPLAARLEVLAVDWLRDLFGLPQGWGGVLTTGATMANFVGLACARSWWAEQHGVDVDVEGLGELPAVPVLSSGYVHPSATKALAMLGIGRERVRRLARDAAGRLDLGALERELAALGDQPAIVIGNAGEVNTGDFDPIAAMADLCEEHGAWLHVDGAFGLFAAVSPRTAHLVSGVERAHSAISDGHKWLNVPHDTGFAFLRDPSRLGRVFSVAAAYLPAPDDERPVFFNLGPESSRRARSLAVWATLRAYGRGGYRRIVERHLDLAQRIAAKVDEAPDFERLAEVPLNIVCFRYRPPDVPEEELNELNERIGREVMADGRLYVGTTIFEGKAAFRPAIVNWRTAEEDVDQIVEVIRELGARASA
ncbi:MAG TPA: aspartate aminotransferase family protein [Actinomycetota bacterium]|nr:aspartate aminotransferase family protein [Actinomycetota bacterium]